MTIVAPGRDSVNRAKTTAAPTPFVPQNDLCSVPARLWAGIQARALRLYADGRRVEPLGRGQFRILCPDDAAYVPHVVRVVSVSPFRYVCSCKCYGQHQGCKHGIGLPALIFAQLAEYDARLRNLPVLELDAYTRRLLHLGANPHLVTSAGLQIETADRLDAAAWDLRAAWAHTLDAHCEMYLGETLAGYVPEWGAK